MSSRERVLLAAAGMLVLVVLLHQLVVDPFLASKRRLQRALQSEAARVVEMRLLDNQYSLVRANKNDIMGRLRSRDKEFSLFTFVEEQIGTIRMKERVVSIKPTVSGYQDGIRQAVIDLKIERVVLAQLVDFLSAIESFNEVVFIERIVVQNNSAEDGLLDALLSVVTFEMEPAS